MCVNNLATADTVTLDHLWRLSLFSGHLLACFYCLAELDLAWIHIAAVRNCNTTVFVLYQVLYIKSLCICIDFIFVYQDRQYPGIFHA